MAASSASSFTAGPHNFMTAAEVEFLAEFEKVFITPNFQSDAYHFIGGDIGPFFPQRPVEVPLWLAITLKIRHKCAVRPPEWMAKDWLQNKKREEEEQDTFAVMPSHFLEVSALLFESASDDIPDKETVHNLLRDIQDRRHTKLRKSLHTLKDDDAAALQLNNVTLMEINSVRAFFVTAMNDFSKLAADQ